MARAYAIENGVMNRDGEAIGEVVGNELRFYPGMKRYAGPAMKYFHEWQALGDGCRYEHEPDMRDTDRQFDADPIEALRKRYPDYKGTLQRKHGDMTTEFVWWLHIHHPAEAEVRYKNRTIKW